MPSCPKRGSFSFRGISAMCHSSSVIVRQRTVQSESLVSSFYGDRAFQNTVFSLFTLAKKKRKTKPVLRVKVNFRVDSLIRTDAHHRTALVKKEKKKECKLLCHCRKVVIGPIGCRGTQTRLERTLPAMRLNRGGGGRGGKGSTSLTLPTLPGAYRKMRHEMHALSRLRSFPAGSASVSTCRSIRFFARARVDSRR